MLPACSDMLACNDRISHGMHGTIWRAGDLGLSIVAVARATTSLRWDERDTIHVADRAQGGRPGPPVRPHAGSPAVGGWAGGGVLPAGRRGARRGPAHHPPVRPQQAGREQEPGEGQRASDRTR
jgi:hypothetical protein